mmetsp:Transcript_112893/g.199267  ORF Transcript_112893/g.199267 Transcript_112893/m.199267 type:complete len:82 (-) Transcript_112893:102-347(-)
MQGSKNLQRPPKQSAANSSILDSLTLHREFELSRCLCTQLESKKGVGQKHGKGNPWYFENAYGNSLIVDDDADNDVNEYEH